MSEKITKNDIGKVVRVKCETIAEKYLGNTMGKATSGRIIDVDEGNDKICFQNERGEKAVYNSFELDKFDDPSLDEFFLEVTQCDYDEESRRVAEKLRKAKLPSAYGFLREDIDDVIKVETEEGILSILSFLRSEDLDVRLFGNIENNAKNYLIQANNLTNPFKGLDNDIQLFFKNILNGDKEKIEKAIDTFKKVNSYLADPFKGKDNEEILCGLIAKSFDYDNSREYALSLYDRIAFVLAMVYASTNYNKFKNAKSILDSYNNIRENSSYAYGYGRLKPNASFVKDAIYIVVDNIKKFEGKNFPKLL